MSINLISRNRTIESLHQSDAILSFCGDSKTLKGVQFIKPRHGDKDVMGLANLSGLKTIVIGGAQFSDACAPTIANLRPKTLFLVSTRISPSGLHQISRVGSLKRLVLSGRNICDDHIKSIDWNGITDLQIAKSTITNASISELRRSATLTCLDLFENAGVTYVDCKQLFEEMRLTSLLIDGEEQL